LGATVFTPSCLVTARAGRSDRESSPRGALSHKYCKDIAVLIHGVTMEGLSACTGGETQLTLSSGCSLSNRSFKQCSWLSCPSSDRKHAIGASGEPGNYSLYPIVILLHVTYENITGNSQPLSDSHSTCFSAGTRCPEEPDNRSRRCISSIKRRVHEIITDQQHSRESIADVFLQGLTPIGFYK
jgi:hypothetical protein